MRQVEGQITNPQVSLSIYCCPCWERSKPSFPSPSWYLGGITFTCIYTKACSYAVSATLLLYPEAVFEGKFAWPRYSLVLLAEEIVSEVKTFR